MRDWLRSSLALPRRLVTVTAGALTPSAAAFQRFAKASRNYVAVRGRRGCVPQSAKRFRTTFLGRPWGKGP